MCADTLRMAAAMECDAILQREDRFTVKAFDCQPDGRLKLNALMQYLQESAARHAEQLGFGFEDMEKQGCFWVLTNFRLEITREPKWTDRFVVRTWPSGHTRLTATREFIGEAHEGGELFRAASEWMILDRHSARPRNLSRLSVGLPPNGPKALSTPVERLKPAQGYSRAHALQVPFSALDFNGHVNNTEYIRWAMDGLHSMLGRSVQIRQVQMTYLAELFEGDEVEVLLRPDGDAHVHILERSARGPADAFLMEVRY